VSREKFFLIFRTTSRHLWFMCDFDTGHARGRR